MRRRTSLVLLNTLSLSRLPLAALFVWNESVAVRVALVVAAAFTDFLDGWIARRKHLESYWGALIDPLADRGFVMVALLTYMLEGRLTLVAFGVLVVRDVATGLGFLVARVVPRLRPVVKCFLATRNRPSGLQLGWLRRRNFSVVTCRLSEPSRFMIQMLSPPPRSDVNAIRRPSGEKRG